MRRLENDRTHIVKSPKDLIEAFYNLSMTAIEYKLDFFKDSYCIIFNKKVNVLNRLLALTIRISVFSHVFLAPNYRKYIFGKQKKEF